MESSRSSWSGLADVYGRPYDPGAALNRLGLSISDPAAWEDLWSHLYHQGGVGEIAYAVVPALVRVYQFSRALEWNAYALVATVDLARDADGNPPLPDRIAPEYSLAISALANLGRRQIESAASLTEVRSILAILALHKGARLQAHFLLDYEPDELVDMEQVWKNAGRP
ncbi:MAG: hypothetical protein E6J40_10665 [Chloroflexi bacterium]|nr:MAG: hypothetical protein E6J40_10665 [Chloroflexota bacterium]